jgi:hypothetical protein
MDRSGAVSWVCKYRGMRTDEEHIFVFSIVYHKVSFVDWVDLAWNSDRWWAVVKTVVERQVRERREISGIAACCSGETLLNGIN